MLKIVLDFILLNLYSDYIFLSTCLFSTICIVIFSDIYEPKTKLILLYNSQVDVLIFRSQAPSRRQRQTTDAFKIKRTGYLMTMVR